MSARTLGSVVAAVGGIVLALSVLADPLGIGGTDEFGWKQIVGAIIGAAGLLVGLLLVYLPQRSEVEPGAEE